MNTLESISLKDADRQAILEAAKVLRQQFPIAAAMLFGSKARGEADSESDIDLLVLTRRELNANERDAAVDSVFDLQLKWNVVISLLIASQEQWNAGVYRVLPIRQEFERDGIAA